MLTCCCPSSNADMQLRFAQRSMSGLERFFLGTERDGGPGEMTRSRPCAVSLQVALDVWLTKYSESVHADLYIAADDSTVEEPAARTHTVDERER
jgi:hypothetical protein